MIIVFCSLSPPSVGLKSLGLHFRIGNADYVLMISRRTNSLASTLNPGRLGGVNHFLLAAEAPSPTPALNHARALEYVYTYFRTRGVGHEDFRHYYESTEISGLVFFFFSFFKKKTMQ